MMKRIIIVVGFLGFTGCHSDTRFSTDVNADLLRSSVGSLTSPVTIQGNVACTTCDSSNGMAIVVTSSTMGMTAHGLLNGIGNYAVSGSARPGDTLTISMTVTKESGVVSQKATATVPDGGGTVTQDFQF